MANTARAIAEKTRIADGGIELLEDPASNKDTALTLEEHRRYGLEGLLPHSVETLDILVERVLGHLEAKPNDLARYIYLIGIADRNKILFRTVMSDPPTNAIWRTDMTDIGKETDSLGVVEVPADKLWGAETQAGCSGCRRHFQRRHALGAYAENPAVTLVSGAPNSNGRWSSVMRAMLIGLLATAPLLGIFGEAQAESGPRSNHATGPGSCGVYMYWQKAKCVDARNRPDEKSWASEMLSNKDLGEWHQ
jgi:hypothetical protein